jgi:cystathionine gamma-synthase
VVGGALVLADADLAENLAFSQNATGAAGGPFDAWLTLRGIRTLGVRMDRHCENARRVADMLAAHPKVAEVFYPGLASHPGHEIARRQMKAFGGMLSLRIRGGRERAVAVASRVKLFTNATSLGGVESTLEHRASSEGPGSTTPPNLLRVSVGLEHADDLVEDLLQALES